VTAPKVAALLTDFGISDHYVGSMKAALIKAAPDARLIDLTHSIPPQDVRTGAFQLRVSYRSHPAGTLFLCVVDPGVGSERRLLYAEAGAWKFIAPDNGLLSWTFEETPPSLLIDISRSAGDAHVSRTFHGRDILAPAAGRLLNGEPPTGLGPVVTDYERLPFPPVEKVGGLWRGQILAIDAYGNLITNLKADELAPLAKRSKVWFDLATHEGAVRGLSASYASVDEGRLLAIEGGSGFIEIAVRNGSAARTTGLKTGDAVVANFRT